MGRVENVEVYKDTENLCKNNDRLKKSIKNSIEDQKLILENKDIVIHNKKRYESPAKIKVSKKRTLEAASIYSNTKIAVHNFASAANPGGGVRNGSNAQAAKNVISEYLYSFRNIEFAIYCSPRDDQNYRLFHSVFDTDCRNIGNMIK